MLHPVPGGWGSIPSTLMANIGMSGEGQEGRINLSLCSTTARLQINWLWISKRLAPSSGSGNQEKLTDR